MRTNIVIYEALMDAAMRAGPFKTKKDAVEARLKPLARQAVHRDLLADAAAPIGVPDFVLFEVLRGSRRERDFRAVRRALSLLPVPDMAGETQAMRAAGLCRSLRADGAMFERPVGALLAAHCIEHDHELLHRDPDFDALESPHGLKVWRH